jgi:hypothetical protein
MPAEPPHTVEITAELRMASLVDAYKAHGGCPPPQNSHLPPRASRHSIAHDVCRHICDRGGPLARRMNEPSPLCRQWYVQVTPANPAV